MTDAKKKVPSIWISILPMIVMAVVLAVGFGVLGFAAENLLIICAFFTIILARVCGTATWAECAEAASDKVKKAFIAIFIFVFVGMIIGTWMLSGTIPMMLYYGLKWMDPNMFLVSAFLLTSLVSLCTGTSFGSVGTVGLALIGVAQGLGVNLAVAAGAIISGAYVGDKMSPLSDTSNLEAAVADVNLFKHIYHMLWTTLPAAGVCLVVYFFAGQHSSIVSEVNLDSVNEITNGLAGIYHFNVLLLLPLVVVLVGSAMGKPTIPVMFASRVVAGALAIVFQGTNLTSVMSASYNGFKVSLLGMSSEHVAPAILTLLERGGMMSMMATVLKVLCAFLFAGAMTASGFLDGILAWMKTFVKGVGSLTLACILATLMVAIVAGNAYVPILIGGELFKKAYQDMHLDPKNLSQVLGVVGCCVIPLIPWSAAGAYMSGALGVETFSYAPWAIFCYAGIVIAVIWGYLGIGILKMTPEQIAAAEAEERGEESA